jgi:hypothetical protein
MGMPKLNTQPSNGYGILHSYVQRGSSFWPFSVFGLGWVGLGWVGFRLNKSIQFKTSVVFNV